MGLHKNRFVKTDEIADALDAEGAAEKAQEIASKVVTLIRNKAGPLPLAKDAKACVLLLAERKGNSNGQAFLDEMALRAPNMPTLLVDPQMPDVQAPAGCQTVVINAYAQLGGYGNDNAALLGQYPVIGNDLVKAGKQLILIGLCNPYLIRAFPDVTTYFITYSPAPTSEVAAVRALFGTVPMTGRKVVTVEECYKLPGLATPLFRLRSIPMRWSSSIPSCPGTPVSRRATIFRGSISSWPRMVTATTSAASRNFQTAFRRILWPTTKWPLGSLGRGLKIPLE